MRTSVYLQKAGNLFLENRLLKFVMVVLSIAVVVNSFLVLRAIKYQRVILIPPQLTGSIEFVQGKPTDGYLRDITRRIITLATSYSPATARKQFAELLELYAPESYPKASATWYALAGRIEESKVSTAFHLEQLKLTKDGHIEVSGMSQQFSDDMAIDKKQETYVLSYRINDGRFLLLSLSKKEDKWQERGESDGR
jgi:conjugal transfer pilus assembly protein TraE